MACRTLPLRKRVNTKMIPAKIHLQRVFGLAVITLKKPHFGEKHRQSITYIKHAPILFINRSEERFGLGRDEMIQLMEPLGVHYRVEKFPASPHSFWLLDLWLKPTANVIAELLQAQLPAS